MPSNGLRERQRRQRAAQVLDAADRLFATQGYEATRIEQIAAKADVAPATVYNYFVTKPNLLMALAVRHVRAALPERRAFLRALPDDPVDGINRFETLLATQATRHLSRECWRIILAAQHLEPGGQAHRTGERLNLLLRRQYVRVLRHYQGAGRLRADIDVADLADLIVGITTWNFARYIASETTSRDALLATGSRHLDLVLAGLVQQAAAPG
jgi:AcrR family transcriptional regulator